MCVWLAKQLVGAVGGAQTNAAPCCCAAGKLAGLDKKLSRSLEEEVMESSSPLELSKSPVGPLHESNRCGARTAGRDGAGWEGSRRVLCAFRGLLATASNPAPPASSETIRALPCLPFLTNLLRAILTPTHLSHRNHNPAPAAARRWSTSSSRSTTPTPTTTSPSSAPSTLRRRRAWRRRRRRSTPTSWRSQRWEEQEGRRAVAAGRRGGRSAGASGRGPRSQIQIILRVESSRICQDSPGGVGGVLLAAGAGPCHAGVHARERRGRPPPQPQRPRRPGAGTVRRPSDRPADPPAARPAPDAAASCPPSLSSLGARRQVWEATPGFGEEPFLDCLWTAVDEVITLKDCDVYRWGRAAVWSSTASTH